MSSKQLATLEEHLNTGAPNPNAPDPNQRILDEDTYVDALQHIITRDFYPDLYRLDRQNRNLDLYVLYPFPLSLVLPQITIILAPSLRRRGTPGQDHTPTPIKQYRRHKAKQKKHSLSNNDLSKSSIHSNSGNVTNHNHSHNEHTDSMSNINITNHHPLEQREPDEHSSDEEDDDDMDDDLVHYVNGEMLSNEEQSRMKLMNLKQFQNVYTSEDNYSFSEILYKNQLEHFKKFSWIYEQQKNADDRSKYLSILSQQERTIIDPKSKNTAIAAIEGTTKGMEVPKFIQLPSTSKSDDVITNTENTKNTKNITNTVTASSNTSNVTKSTKKRSTSIPQDEDGNNIVALDEQDTVRNDHKSKAQLDAESDKQRVRDEKALQKKVDLYRGELMYWKFKSINKLMFFPEADRELNLQIMKRLQAQYGKPECVYSNTRFPKQFVLKPQELSDHSTINEVDRNLRGFEMVHTPRIKPGHAQDDDTNDSNVEHIGTPIMTWGEVGGTPIALDDDDNPIGPIFKILKVPKKDRIVESLHKQNADKLRKKQEEKLRNSTPRNGIYTPYSTRQIVTPSGNHIHTPLVGVDTPTIGGDERRNHRDKRSGKKRKRKGDHESLRSPRRPSSVTRYGVRSIDDLSPAARKLMERNQKGRNGLSTPLSSKLREAYSVTPNRSGRKRKRTGSLSTSSSRRRDQEETPKLMLKETPTPKKAKRRRKNDDGFEKPTYSLKEKIRKGKIEESGRQKESRKSKTANLTDGLL